jgi:uncharacterized protein (DUF58 family)
MADGGRTMTGRRGVSAVFSTAIVLSLSIALAAQRTVTRSVFIEASGPDDKLLTDLTAADVEVTESGVPRTVVRVTPGSTPMRIVLMVDSSNPVLPLLNSVKTALGAFVDALPPLHEVTLISSGGQIRVRTPPSRDRDRLRTEVASFAPQGGANAFLDTLLEADKRFLKTAPEFWPVFVIVTTDNGENYREPDIPAYNTFMNDFRMRSGTVHAVILQGKRTGPVSVFMTNLTDNTAGSLSIMNTDNSLPARMREIAERLADDHDKMRGRYEVAFEGDPKIVQPIVAVAITREGGRVLMSVRRPF